jgi:hypothetical protein
MKEMGLTHNLAGKRRFVEEIRTRRSGDRARVEEARAVIGEIRAGRGEWAMSEVTAREHERAARSTSLGVTGSGPPRTA